MEETNVKKKILNDLVVGIPPLIPAEANQPIIKGQILQIFILSMEFRKIELRLHPGRGEVKKR